MKKSANRPVQIHAVETKEPVDPSPPGLVTIHRLDEIRRMALNSQAETARTIADLEAWRNEIEATIAFLRAPQK